MLQLTECNVQFSALVNIDQLNIKLSNMNTANSDFANVCQTASFFTFGSKRTLQQSTYTNWLEL